MPSLSPATSLGFEALYRQEIGFVWRTLRFLGVGAADVEDVAHEVFIIVQRRFGDLDPQRSPRAWIGGITRRVVLHHRRSLSRAERKKAALQQVPVPDAEDPDRALSRREAAQLVQTFLDTLDPPRREVFVLMTLEGLTGREVAEIVGTSPNTVSSRLRSARRDFDRFLAQRAQAGGAHGHG